MRPRFAAAAILALVTAGCARKSAPPHQDLVKIADRGFLTNAPIYIADEEGYFADEGIMLEFTEPPRSSSQIIPLLERGDLDVMASSLTAGFFSAVAQGGRSRIVAEAQALDGGRGYLRGVKTFRQGLTPRNLDIISRRTAVTTDVLKTICLPTINANGELNGGSLLDFQKWLVKNGFLSRLLGPEGGTDMTFARQAAKELGIAPASRIR